MEMQTEHKSYSCVQCNLSFKMTKDLKTHMLQHDVKKSQSCNKCGYSCIKAANLKTHMPVHSGEKPFGFWLSTPKEFGNYKVEHDSKVDLIPPKLALGNNPGPAQMLKYYYVRDDIRPNPTTRLDRPGSRP